MSRFMCADLAALEPYVPGEQPQDKKYIKLNTNESPFPPAEGVKRAVCERADMLNLYSDPVCTVFRRAAAERYGLGVENVSPGNGSDENLLHIFYAFLRDKGVAFPDVTYGFYKVLCGALGIEYKIVPLKADFSVNVGDYASISTPVCIANPNAQTGIYLPPEEVEKLVLQNTARLVIIDEAYIDFGGQSCAPLVNKYDNLIVVQTLSKSRSLAGARAGVSFACEALTADIEKVRCSLNPYNINSMTMYAAAAALKDVPYFEKCTREVQSVREYAATTLKNYGFYVLPSLSNFLMAKAEGVSGQKLYEKLKERGILVRHFSDERIKDFIRVSIGTRAQTEQFLHAAIEIVREELHENG